jgi:hypothetical protein
VIGRRHDDHRAQTLLAAPLGKDGPFVFGPGHGPRDLLHGVDAEGPELADLSRGGVFVGNSAAEELAVDHRIGRIGEDGHAGGDATVHEVRGFEDSGAVRAGGDHHDVGGGQGLMHHERLPGRPQHRLREAGRRHRGQAQGTGGGKGADTGRRSQKHAFLP